jgi:hypothetical protein
MTLAASLSESSISRIEFIATLYGLGVFGFTDALEGKKGDSDSRRELEDFLKGRPPCIKVFVGITGLLASR